MHRIDVPFSMKNLMRNNSEKELAEQLHRVGATGIFLCGIDFDNLETTCENINRYAEYFRNEGFEVGLWFSSIFHRVYPNMGFTNMVDIMGKIDPTMTCPADERFREHYAKIVQKLATTRVDRIMLDDDFRISVALKKPMCFCKTHMRLLEKELGEPISLDDLKKHLFTGEPNRFRKAWLRVNGEALAGFARTIRSYVDEVNPTLPIALASGAGLWGTDGVSATEVLEIFSGGNPAYLRLSGGPYWTAPMFWVRYKLEMANIIDLTRRQAAWCRDKNITVVAENDTFPRPRYELAAAKTELFDFAVIADGNFDGSLKYIFDYHAPVSYEKGYVEKTVQNRPLYDEIQKAFGHKKPLGVSVYEPFPIMERLVGKEEDPAPDVELRNINPPAIRLLNDCCIPLHFEDYGPVAVFGDAAKEIPLERLNEGAIIDITAAMHLIKRGIDVGLYENNGLVKSEGVFGLYDNIYYEHFQENELIQTDALKLFEIMVKDGAVIGSRYARPSKDNKSYIGSYTYENKSRQKFLVFAFDGYDNAKTRAVFCNYYRQRQVKEAVEWMMNAPLKAFCGGNPGIYMMEKQGDEELAVGIWNFSLDAIDTPVIALGEKYTEARYINCNGTLENGKVTLSKLGAYEFAAVVLR